jgi:hypothetical protein
MGFRARDTNPESLTNAWYVRPQSGLRGGLGVDPLRHYIETGAGAGADPAPDFSTKRYVAKNPESARLNPLEHF